MAKEGEIPMKEIIPFTELFGSLFDKYWGQFYETHKAEFEEFLKVNKLTDEKLAKSGTNKEELGKQFCAVQLSYYLFRYSGLLNVRYTRVENREEIKGKIEVASGPPLKTSDIMGERFGLMLSDILSGRMYKMPGALDTFSTFGDCDETAFLIAQGIDAINKAHNLGMQISLVPISNHTNVGIKFNGVRGVFRIDPTMLVHGIEGGKYPEKPFTKEDLEEIAMNEEPQEKEYKEKIIPRLNRKIGPITSDTLVHRSQAERIENAVATASTNSYFNLNLAFASMRILMSKSVRDKPETLAKVTRYIEKLENANPELIDIVNRCLAAFDKNYGQALSKLQEVQKGLTPAQSLELLKTVAKEMVKGKDVYAAIKLAGPKIAMAG